MSCIPNVSDGKVGRLTDIAYVYLRSFPLFRREQHTAIKKFPPLIRSVQPEYSIPKFCAQQCWVSGKNSRKKELWSDKDWRNLLVSNSTIFLSLSQVSREQGWRSGESARLPPMWPGFKPRCRYVGWVCCWFSPLLREVFLRVLRFSPLPKNQHFQIPIRSGTHGHWKTSS